MAIFPKVSKVMKKLTVKVDITRDQLTVFTKYLWKSRTRTVIETFGTKSTVQVNSQ